jgi:PAS domain S-box-containing protein
LRKVANRFNQFWAHWRSWARPFRCLLLVVLFSTTLRPVDQPGDRLPVLTHAEQIRQLTTEEAERAYPVHLRAVVTYFDPGTDLFVQDSSAGIWIDLGDISKLALKAGQLVEVEGVTSAPDFAPEISKPRITVLGETPLPRSKPVSFDQMASGAEDSQWVEVEGIVHSAHVDQGHLGLGVVVGAGQRTRLTASIPNFHQPVPAGLLDARIRLRGACASVFNKKNQLIGVSLLVPSLDQVEIEERGSADPFSMPVRAINSLLRFSANGTSRHIVRVQGVVTLQVPGRSLFIKDETQGLYVETDQSTLVQPGDRVDVAGFPSLGAYNPFLVDAMFRKLGTGVEPVPISASGEKAKQGACDTELIQIEATLLDQAQGRAGKTMILQSGNVIFESELLEYDHGKGWPHLKKASRLQLTGVCSTHADEASIPQAFTLLLRSPKDIVVLQRPPWWTVDRALSIVGLLMVFGVAVTWWTVTLRQRVAERTETVRATLESTAECILVVNAAGTVVAYNQKLVSLWRIPETVLRLNTVVPIKSFLVQLREPEIFRARFKTSSDVQTDDVLELKDGRVFECHSEARRLGETSIGRVWSFRDVTGRELAERHINFQASLLRQVRNAVIATDLDNKITYWNKHAETLYQWKAREVAGRDVRALVPQEARGLWREMTDSLRLNGYWEGEFPAALRKDGTRLPVHTMHTVTRDSQGNVEGFLGVSTDITERKQTEEALQRSEEEYRLLFEASPHPMWVYDLGTLRFLQVNDAAVAQYGYTRTEFLAMNIEAIRPQEDIPALLETVAKLRPGLHSSGVWRHRKKDGTLIDVEIVSHEILFWGRHAELVLANDVTDRKRAEAELQELSARLIHSQDEERRRIARELHDSTGQALMAIVLNLGVVSKGAAKLSQQARDAVSESSTIAKQCLREIRTLSYLLHPPVLDEFGLASALRCYASGFAQRSGIHVDVDIPQELSRLPTAVEMTVFRIVQESLTNVHRHSGSKKAEIRLLVHPDYARVEVKDYGRGINSNGANHKGREIQGLGVGIYGMRERVKQLGGELQIDSGKQGTTVRASLPILWRTYETHSDPGR